MCQVDIGVKSWNYWFTCEYLTIYLSTLTWYRSYCFTGCWCKQVDNIWVAFGGDLRWKDRKKHYKKRVSYSRGVCGAWGKSDKTIYVCHAWNLPNVTYTAFAYLCCVWRCLRATKEYIYSFFISFMVCLVLKTQQSKFMRDTYI